MVPRLQIGGGETNVGLAYLNEQDRQRQMDDTEWNMAMQAGQRQQQMNQEFQYRQQALNQALGIQNQNDAFRNKQLEQQGQQFQQSMGLNQQKQDAEEDYKNRALQQALGIHQDEFGLQKQQFGLQQQGLAQKEQDFQANQQRLAQADQEKQWDVQDRLDAQERDKNIAPLQSLLNGPRASKLSPDTIDLINQQISQHHDAYAQKVRARRGLSDPNAQVGDFSTGAPGTDSSGNPTAPAGMSQADFANMAGNNGMTNVSVAGPGGNPSSAPPPAAPMPEMPITRGQPGQGEDDSSIQPKAKAGNRAIDTGNAAGGNVYARVAADERAAAAQEKAAKQARLDNVASFGSLSKRLAQMEKDKLPGVDMQQLADVQGALEEYSKSGEGSFADFKQKYGADLAALSSQHAKASTAQQQQNEQANKQKQNDELLKTLNSKDLSYDQKMQAIADSGLDDSKKQNMIANDKTTQYIQSTLSDMQKAQDPQKQLDILDATIARLKMSIPENADKNSVFQAESANEAKYSPGHWTPSIGGFGGARLTYTPDKLQSAKDAWNQQSEKELSQLERQGIEPQAVLKRLEAARDAIATGDVEQQDGESDMAFAKRQKAAKEQAQAVQFERDTRGLSPSQVLAKQPDDAPDSMRVLRNSDGSVAKKNPDGALGWIYDRNMDNNPDEFQPRTKDQAVAYAQAKQNMNAQEFERIKGSFSDPTAYLGAGARTAADLAMVVLPELYGAKVAAAGGGAALKTGQALSNAGDFMLQGSQDAGLLKLPGTMAGGTLKLAGKGLEAAGGALNPEAKAAMEAKALRAQAGPPGAMGEGPVKVGDTSPLPVEDMRPAGSPARSASGFDDLRRAGETSPLHFDPAQGSATSAGADAGGAMAKEVQTGGGMNQEDLKAVAKKLGVSQSDVQNMASRASSVEEVQKGFAKTSESLNAAPSVSGTGAGAGANTPLTGDEVEAMVKRGYGLQQTYSMAKASGPDAVRQILAQSPEEQVAYEMERLKDAQASAASAAEKPINLKKPAVTATPTSKPPTVQELMSKPEMNPATNPQIKAVQDAHVAQVSSAQGLKPETGAAYQKASQALESIPNSSIMPGAKINGQAVTAEAQNALDEAAASTDPRKVAADANGQFNQRDWANNLMKAKDEADIKEVYNQMRNGTIDAKTAEDRVKGILRAQALRGEQQAASDAAKGAGLMDDSMLGKSRVGARR